MIGYPRKISTVWLRSWREAPTLTFSIQPDDPCLGDDVTLDRVLEIRTALRRREAEGGVERIQIEDVVMDPARRTGAAVLARAESVQSLDGTGGNVVLPDLRDGGREIPHQPVREGSAWRVGIGHLQRQTARRPRHVAEGERRRHVQSIAGVLLRDCAAAYENRTADGHPARRPRNGGLIITVRIHARDRKHQQQA
jgi:hypothetical protein